MFTNTLDPDNPLTPSELVFLNGEQFAKKVTLGNVDLMHTGEKVSLAQLTGTILAAAILACEQAGAFRLEFRDRKAMLGLRKVRELFTVPPTPGVTCRKIAWKPPFLSWRLTWRRRIKTISTAFSTPGCVKTAWLPGTLSWSC